MAPAATIDEESQADFNTFKPIPHEILPGNKVLLISPPSLSAHPEKLAKVVEDHAQYDADLQMLDRVIAGSVTLPDETYDVVLILNSAEENAQESAKMLELEVNGDGFALLAKAMKPSAKVWSQDVQFGNGMEGASAVMAGLNPVMGGGFEKPAYDPNAVVPLKKKKKYFKEGQVDRNGKPFTTRKILLDEDGLIDEDSLMEGVERRPKFAQRPEECKLPWTDSSHSNLDTDILTSLCREESQTSPCLQGLYLRTR